MAKAKEDKSLSVIVNGFEQGCDNPNSAFAYTLSLFSDQVHYMSDDAIKKIICEIWDMIYDTEEEGGLGIRVYHGNKDFKYYINKDYLVGDKLKATFYELILKKEGMAVGKEVYVNRHGDPVTTKPKVAR